MPCLRRYRQSWMHVYKSFEHIARLQFLTEEPNHKPANKFHIYYMNFLYSAVSSNELKALYILLSVVYIETSPYFLICPTGLVVMPQDSLHCIPNALPYAYL